MSQLIHELRTTLRSLARRPGFSLVVVSTLSLGIGANTVIFDLLNLALWRRPPVESPEELVRLHMRGNDAWLGQFGTVSYADFLDYEARAASYSHLSTVFLYNFIVDTGEVSDNVTAGVVTPSYFELLGVGAALGRIFTPADAVPGGDKVVVLSHRLWHRLFQADPGIVGRTVRLDGRPFTVIGVAAEGFDGTMAGQRRGLWTMFEHHREALDVRDDRTWAWTWMLGRLRPGTSHGQAQAELQLLAGALDREHPLDAGPRVMTVVEARFMLPLDQRSLGSTLQLLLAAVGLVLLITCANVANLLLARATSRRREMAVRTALGAGRWHLVRPLVLESLVLAAAGGLLGLGLGVLGRRLVAASFAFQNSNVFDESVRFDARLLGLVALACLGSALLATVAPALRALRADLVRDIKIDEATGTPGRRLSPGDLLVVVQVALCMVLLSSTGLVARSMWNLWSADTGFDTDNLVTVQPTIARTGYPMDQSQALSHQLVERLEALPGVRSAGRALLVPPLPFDFNVELRLPETPEVPRSARMNLVDTGFFETLDIPLVEGRLFADHDAESERGVVVINTTLAERLWPGRTALGREILLEAAAEGDPGGPHEVVGIVGATVQDSFKETSQPILYFSAEQRYRTYLAFVLRTEGDPLAVIPALKDEMRRLDPALVLDYVRTHDEARWNFLIGERIRTLILGSFGLVGLLLAVVGVASVLSYSVSRRVREMGIRMALGASGADVRRLVLRRGALLSAAGIAAGTLGAMWAAQVLRSLLFGVDGIDAWTLGAVALLLVSAALAAAWWPARRASAVDPWIALRSE